MLRLADLDPTGRSLRRAPTRCDMCGFAGSLDLSGAGAHPGILPQTIAVQLALLRHRGPDQSAVHLSPEGRLGLGVCRLSIVDVPGGRQPMVNEDGTIVLAYNGETYNATELLATLEAAGHRPRSRNDGECLLHGYEEWGIGPALRRLRGMLAAALWDETRGRLILARDRFGIKPVFYAVHQGRLCFASELKPILALPGFPRDPDPMALDALFHVGFLPGPRTPFERIEELPPGCFLVADRDGIRVEPYWELDVAGAARVPAEEAVERFGAALRDAVRVRLPREVPFGALLSGGIDSSAVACLAAAETGGGLSTFSIGFDDPALDETRWASAVAAHAGTRHRSFQFHSADWEDFPAVIRCLEEPSASGTALVLWRIFEGCRREGMTVVLSGEGSDELLGGYGWHRGDRLALPLLRLPGPVRRAVASLPIPMSAAARRVVERGNRSIARRYLDWYQAAEVATARSLLAPALRERLPRGERNPLLVRWDAIAAANGEASPLDQGIALQARTFLPSYILQRLDRTSMAHSIEARVPFLDHELWQLTAGIPAGLKLRRGTEKHLLRESMKGVVPDAARRRRKQPLLSPMGELLARERWPEWAESCFSQRALEAAGILAPAAALELRRAQRARPGDWTRILFAALTTQLWHQELVAAPPRLARSEIDSLSY